MVARLDTDLIIAQAVADAVAERFALGDIAVSLSDAGGGRWQVAIHFRERPSGSACGARWPQPSGPKLRPRCNSDRSKQPIGCVESLAGLRPVAAGRFVVHGAHDRARVPLNRIGIEIEAALAFGTGHHGTTRGCLLALDAICKAMPLRQKPGRAFSMSARAPACWPSPPLAHCTRTCWRPTSTPSP